MHATQRTAPCCLQARAPSSIHEKKRRDTHSAVRSLETIDLLLRAIELVLGSQGLENLNDVVPELLMVLVKQDDEAGGLGVERRRNMEEGLLNELADLGVGNGSLLVELVVCAALLDGLEDRLCELGSSHVGCGGCKGSARNRIGRSR